MLYALTSTEITLIAIVGFCALLAVIFIIVAAVNIKKVKKMKNGEETADKIIVDKGVRYTKSEVIAKDGENKVTHIKGDFILSRGVEYKVIKNGELMPGKYTILSSDDKSESFYIRIGGFVREYYHNSPVVLSEGDVVCAVSHTVILR